jgi:predicted nucleotidyltransferase
MDAGVLGFSNRWYPEGIERAQRRILPDGQEIAIFTLPYFLASKIEAFLGRGKGDYYGSRDIEDLVAVLDGAEGVREEVRAGPETVLAYLRERFAAFLRDELFEQSVAGHLGPKAGAGRTQRVLEALRDLAKE